MKYLKQYEYIAAIAEFGSVTVAAEQLGIAQPALSRYVKTLEKSLGVPLLDRSAQPLALTQAGRCFLETGEKMLALDQSMKWRIRNLQSSECANVRIGIGPSRAPYILPPILERFHKHDKQTNLIIFELTTDEIKQRLLKNELDLAISVYDTDSSHITCIPLFRERILLCENEKSSCRRPIYPGQGQLLRNVMNDLVVRNGEEPTPYIEVQNTETAVSLVKAGLGFTVVPSYFEEFSFGDGLKYSELPHILSAGERMISLMHHKNKTLSAEENLFAQCAKQALT